MVKSRIISNFIVQFYWRCNMIVRCAKFGSKNVIVNEKTTDMI